MKKIYFYIFIFLLASILGWFGEFIWRSIYFKQLVNPGALIGPFCPIYGTAAIVLFLTLSKKDKIIINLINIVIVSTLVEYCTALISEEIFNHKLWSYSHLPLNFQGRVCLNMTVVFSIVGLIGFYYIKPLVEKYYENHQLVVKYFDYIFGFLFLCNIILQPVIMRFI